MRKQLAFTVPQFLIAAVLSVVLPPLSPASEIPFIPLGTTDRVNNAAGSPGWHYRLGTSEASTPVAAWRTSTFVEDGTWSVGGLPLGFATAANDPNNYEANLVTTVPAATASVFLRKTFVVTNRLSYSSVTVNGFADDGVVVWINGQEATSRFQCCTAGTDPNIPTFNALATAALESLPFSFSFPNDASGPLVEGTNVLAIQLFNANSTSSDLVVDASLSASLDDVAPVVSGQSPQAGGTVLELKAIQINFSEAVAGVDASDLLINGVAATNVMSVSPSIYTFEFPQPGTGVVSIAFASPHGIFDTVGNPLTTNAWNYTLNPAAVVASVYISEFLASNNGNGTNALRDEDGDASDWIELRNPAAAPADISGWYLTDATNTLANPNNLTKWRFPDGTTVPGNGYLVVFASGKNRTNNLARLHSNFQLSAGGEYLALLNTSTQVVSEFYPAYPSNQVQNVSYGRDQADPERVGFFAVPTPGAANNTGSNPELGVEFSRTGGPFAGSFQLSLTSAPTAVIRYVIVSVAQDVNTATNIPTASSPLYTGPITINNSVQVRARAFPASGSGFPGAPRTELYFQIANGITNFVSDLPIVLIHTVAPTALSGGFPTPDNSVMITCLDNDTPSGRAGILDRPQMVKRAGLNLRGSSTQGFPKSSYAIEFWDEFNNDEEASFAGLPAESDWVLYAPNQFDLSLMHNPIMHQMGRDFGYYSSRTRFVEVFFRNGAGPITATTNATGAAMGDYNGVYVLEEKVKRDGNRVDIDVLHPEHRTAPEVTGGYLLKVDRTDGNERTFSGGGMTINYVEPEGLEMVTPARAAQAAYIKAYLDNMSAGLQGANLINVNSTNHYSNYIDVDATIDLHIGNVMVMNADGYRLSGYMYKPRGGKLVAGPLWDVDRGLGTSRGDARTYNPRSWQSFDANCGTGTDYGTDFFGGSGINTWPWLTRWFSDVDFWQRWVDRYQEKRTSVLDTNYLASVVDRFAAQVREAQVREQKRWAGSGASDTSPRVGTVANCTGVYSHNFPGTYQGEVDFQKRWLIDHVHFIDTNLLNRPSHNLPEGQVPMGSVLVLSDTSGKPGTQIYYTLDGSDPRGLQGVINPSAQLYSGPIVITNNVRVRARARNMAHSNLTGTTPSGPSGTRNPIVSTPWSGDKAATFYITPPPLVISELMFHPAPSASLSDTNDVDNYEYVELQNVGTNTLSLAGFRFTNGISFTFSASNSVTTVAPGGHVLIVKNLASFTSRYGARTNIAGIFEGNLDNGGERLTLVGPRLEPILDFTYSDNWYPLSDGLGFSLVIRDPHAPLNSWDDSQSWRISAGENGSPGVVDPTPPPIPVIFINEALTHTDLPSVDTVELSNPGTNAANIGGWYLTDDPSEPKKYQIPLGTTIAAGGFLLIDETQFNAGLNAFALGSTGDELYLFSATNGLLTGWAHGFSFGAAQNGVTFGRYVTSQNRDHFVAQATNTLGAPNSLPLVGPIVISEIMYHPPDSLSGTNLVDNGLDEFIELYNITPNPVALYHPTNLANTWRLRSGVDFNFPTNITIAPTSYVFVVNFNPNTNLTQLAAFRAKYGLAGSVPVFGPYGGKLDNSSELVRLSRPDNTNLDGTLPYIVVDEVEYEDQGAWSLTADGIGASLQRLVLTDYANDPTNWVAAAPSPAAPFRGGTPPLITQQPANAAQFLGSTTNFTATVSGTGVSIQWRFNNDPIPGATNAVLTLSNIQYAQGGSYNFVAFNGAGSAFSSNATLTVITPVFFSIQPASQNVQPGTNVTLNALAVGNGPVRYQWYFEGNPIPGATNSSHSFTGANLAQHHGNFHVMATDDLGSTLSSNAEIYVMVRVGIVSQIQPMTVLQGGTVTFSVTATGAPTLWYRWIRGGAAFLTNTSSTLTLTNVQVGGTYRVGITNRATPAGVFSLPSGSVTLTVLPDADRDGLADGWETNYFGNNNTTNNAANALEDPDGDGMINRDEYVAGTHPLDPSSLLKIILSGTNTTRLQFVAQTNISYSIQTRTNLTAGPWTSISNIPGQGSTRTIEVNTASSPAAPQRYWRIITPQAP